MYKNVRQLGLLTMTLAGIVTLCNSLIVNHNFEDGMDTYSYQTFTGVAMYSAKDAPSKSNPGNGESYVEFDLSINRTYTRDGATLELILIPDTNIINHIGVYYKNEFRICCDDELISAGKCNDTIKNRLIVNKNINGLTRFDINFESEQETYSLHNQKFDITVTGIYVFGLASCNDDLGIITFSGESVWMNPYGQLPGDMYGYLVFYGYMCISYLVIAAIWSFLNAIYWQQLLCVQNCISGVLVLCVIEMATWYFDYLNFNITGVRHDGPYIFGLITTVSRRMAWRMLALVVSMGYGIVKPTLGKSVRNKIIILACIYWIFAFMFEVLIHYNQTENVKTLMRVVLIPPVVIIDGIFIVWIFVSLNRIIKHLNATKQSAKLKLYKYFKIVLIVSIIAHIAFFVCEMYYVLEEFYYVEWQILWLMEIGVWDILFSITFVAVAILCRPSQHFKQCCESLQIEATVTESTVRDEAEPMPSNAEGA